MKTVAEHFNTLTAADRQQVALAAERIVNEPVFRIIFDGLMAHALTQIATVDPTNTNVIRMWQQRYQALKQIDIELRNFESNIPKEKLRVV